MNWKREHNERLKFTIAIIILVAIIVLSTLNPDKISLPSKITYGMTTTIETPVAVAGSEISSFFYGITHFRSIQKENFELKKELGELQKQLNDAKLTSAQYTELKNLSNRLDYSAFADNYRKVTANVIAMDDSQFFNIFTINQGKKKGIAKDDIVVNSLGLIGRVMSVGNNWAKVISLADSSNSVSFTILRDPSVMGIVSGSGDGALVGYVFDDNKSVLEGDKLLTSDIGMYPPGIEIGTVKKVKLSPSSDEKTVMVSPSVNFASLKLVTVFVN